MSYEIYNPNFPITDHIHSYVLINRYWDRTSKVLICLVDAGLNYYFLRTVRVRLVKHLGLIKYAPLVSFNMKLMIVSISMDVGYPFVIFNIIFISHDDLLKIST